MSATDPTTTLPSEEAAFRRLLTAQVLRYPQMEIQDLYKLIFQASFGSEHAVGGFEVARRRLLHELHGLPHGPEEPTADPISPDGRIVRVNLRPYLANGGDPAALLEAFVRTGREYCGAGATLRRYWRYAERMATVGPFAFAPEALQGFFAKIQAAGFPAMRHSPAYTTAYRPAYRVVLYRLLCRR
ncbi:MAG TPA: hypothetical protein VHN13_02935 [Candidatus Tectomicrobia bacterium]|jgi:hypothetical protein|nr:hypothetical protein [Candidatus Tectomicrobia bacterium]